MSATEAPLVSVSRRRRLVYMLTAVTVAVVVSVGGLLAVDIYLHHKVARSGGLNIWGYRGAVVGKKKPGEYRLVMLGGSTAFGYGTAADEAIPAVLERNLAGRSVGPFQRFTAINLGYNNEGSYSFRFTLNDYLYLRYDLAILYEGYNDLTADPRNPNVSVFRHDSPVFRLTGYMPIFPLVFKEKAGMMLTGDAGAPYRRDQPVTVFRPGLATKAAAGVLRGAAEVGESLERQLARVSNEPPRRVDDPASTGCKSPWQQYCRSTLVAVDFALQHGLQVIVAAQPHGVGESFRKRHLEQQTELAAVLQRHYGGDRRVRYVDFSELLDLSDPSISFDRMHLTAPGNRRMAEAFVQPVLEMAAARAAGQR
jgi:hypothetical protein